MLQAKYLTYHYEYTKGVFMWRDLDAAGYEVAGLNLFLGREITEEDVKNYNPNPPIRHGEPMTLHSKYAFGNIIHADFIRRRPSTR